jgi:hypothetical protein
MSLRLSMEISRLTKTLCNLIANRVTESCRLLHMCALVCEDTFVQIYLMEKADIV